MHFLPFLAVCPAFLDTSSVAARPQIAAFGPACLGGSRPVGSARFSNSSKPMPLLRFIPETTNVNFVKYRYAAFAVDGLLLVVAIFFIWYQGFNLGIDFTGGVLMEVKSQKEIDIGQMRADVESLGFPESQLQYFGGGGGCDRPVNSCVMIRIQPDAAQAGADQDQVDQAVVGAVKKHLGPTYEYRRTEVVGPRVSGELLNDGILATILAVAMI